MLHPNGLQLRNLLALATWLQGRAVGTELCAWAPPPWLVGLGGPELAPSLGVLELVQLESGGPGAEVRPRGPGGLWAMG